MIVTNKDTAAELVFDSWNAGTSDTSYSVAWGDVNGDGWLDLAVGNVGQNRVYLNQNSILHREYEH